MLRPHGIDLIWYTQPSSPKTYQARATYDLTGVDLSSLASQLANLSLAFEIFDSEASVQIFYHRGLGLKTIQLDDAGEPVIRFAQLDMIQQQAAGSSYEYDRLLRLARAQAWQDVLDPLRRGWVALDGLRDVS